MSAGNIFAVGFCCAAAIVLAAPGAAAQNATANTQQFGDLDVSGTVQGIVKPDYSSRAVAIGPIRMDAEQLRCLEGRIREALNRSQTLGGSAVMFDGLVFCGQR